MGRIAFQFIGHKNFHSIFYFSKSLYLLMRFQNGCSEKENYLRSFNEN